MNALISQLPVPPRQNSFFRMTPQGSFLNVPYQNRTVVIAVEDIVYLQGEGNYTSIYLRDKQRYLVSKTLKAFTNQLDDALFVRVHKSTIVNLNYVQVDNFSLSRCLYLIDGREIPISRRRTKDIELRLHRFRMGNNPSGTS